MAQEAAIGWHAACGPGGPAARRLVARAAMQTIGPPVAVAFTIAALRLSCRPPGMQPGAASRSRGATSSSWARALIDGARVPRTGAWAAQARGDAASMRMKVIADMSGLSRAKVT